MTSDGGGWMKILQYNNAPYTPTAAAVGDHRVGGNPAIAKLADTNINTLSVDSGTYREYRFQGDDVDEEAVHEGQRAWNDTARGEGLILTGPAPPARRRPTAPTAT